jgi:hypothetical protein
LKIKRVILILLIICFSISLLGCTNKNATNTESTSLDEKLNTSINALAKSEEAINLDGQNEEMSKEGTVYSCEWQDLIDNSKNKTVVLSATLDDIAKINNDYYIYFTSYSLSFRLKCSKEQVNTFIKDNKNKPYLIYIIVAKVNRSFRPMLNFSSDVVDTGNKDNPESEVTVNSDNVLIIDGELVKAIPYEE